MTASAACRHLFGRVKIGILSLTFPVLPNLDAGYSAWSMSENLSVKGGSMKPGKTLSAAVLAAAIALILPFATGCGGGREGDGATGGDAGGRSTTGSAVTASKAFAECRAEVEGLVSAGGMLSQVVGRNVDAKGASASWDFIVLGPEREGATLKEHHITWNRGKVDSSAVYDCDTLGYENSPAYAHYFKPVEEGWVDSPGIADAFVKRYPEGKASLGTLEMRIKYIHDPARGLEGSYWEVAWEGEQRGMPHALFDARSGDFAGETDVL